jgi:hypothetical protein
MEMEWRLPWAESEVGRAIGTVFIKQKKSLTNLNWDDEPNN